jgi:ribosomal-protein-alanine N-acetyltransferase
MILTTDRLLLREFEESDWSTVLAYQSDPEYLCYSPWAHRTEEEVRDFVGQFVAWRVEQPRRKFQFAIVLPAEERLIGSCGIRSARTVERHIDHADEREADVGYELDSRYWGRGYATEAARALLRFGFRELGLHRIWSHCLAENRASARVLEKIGMRQEGHLRENEWMKGRWWDTLLYAILAHEWQAQGL